ncbi:hypothetical protein K443DRAFT_276163 [Laccaria amethystina LaAM-08-1]|uniref:Uncharacterized protein n=1 Tax=Laccaria amethystina LaAM-08-1 TaxID=1095629 RepID=A0A0C9WVU4_9AGAR|nr:hypothetical protein K443DRAFT_276163 [Laccaria amethystina LaAM-08-1]
MVMLACCLASRESYPFAVKRIGNLNTSSPCAAIQPIHVGSEGESFGRFATTYPTLLSLRLSFAWHAVLPLNSTRASLE